MGRSILGALVGLVASWFTAFVIVMVAGFALGADGIRDAADKSPTMVWLVVMLIVTAVTAYLGGAIARAIGKDKLATLIIMGIVVLLSIVGFVMAGQTPPEQKIPEDTPDWVMTMVAMGEAQQNSPKWLMFVSPIVSLAGLWFGGIAKGDFGKPDAAPNMPPM